MLRWTRNQVLVPWHPNPRGRAHRATSAAYKRGDVALVLFPHPDSRTAKTRPALVVQADDLQTGLPYVIAAMITTP